eukprot:gene3639-2574_t
MHSAAEEPFSSAPPDKRVQPCPYTATQAMRSTTTTISFPFLCFQLVLFVPSLCTFGVVVKIYPLPPFFDLFDCFSFPGQQQQTHIIILFRLYPKATTFSHENADKKWQCDMSGAMIQCCYCSVVPIPAPSLFSYNYCLKYPRMYLAVPPCIV